MQYDVVDLTETFLVKVISSLNTDDSVQPFSLTRLYKIAQHC